MRVHVGAARTASMDIPSRYHSSSFFLRLFDAKNTRSFHLMDDTLSQRMRPSCTTCR